MGVHSMVLHAALKMKRQDTANPRTLGSWTRRLLGIATDLEKSNDLAKQEKLAAVVSTVAQQFADADVVQPGQSTSQLAPTIYQKRKQILCAADQALNDLQPPPEGHPEEMMKAISKDDRALASILGELSEADDGLLKEVVDLVLPLERDDDQETSRCMSVESPERKSTASQCTLRNEKAYEQFEQKLVRHTLFSAPSIVIGIADMGSENSEVHAHFIPLDHTFCALADSLTEFDDESFLPDFWSKETYPEYKDVQQSAVWWEWQDPSKKVVDTITKEGHIGIETVCKEVEYIVVLVRKGEVENGIPIDIPRRCRQRAFLYLQQHFPNHTVSQVRRLKLGELGDDVKDVMFDSRYFRHQTNPLFVELRADRNQPKPTLVDEDVKGVAKLDKGKGRARDA